MPSSIELAWVRMRSSKPGPLPSPKEAMDSTYTMAERQLADAYSSMRVVGDPSAVRTRIEELAERTLAEEVMVTTNIYDHAERLRSYNRLAAAAFETATPGKEAALDRYSAKRRQHSRGERAPS